MTDFVYLIHDNFSKAYKIGVSSNPTARLANLQTASARGDLKLLFILEGSFDLEVFIHEKFSKYRLKGEWFEESEEILKYFEDKITPTIIHKDFKLNMNNAYKHRIRVAQFFKENPIFLKGFKSESCSGGKEVFLSYQGSSEYSNMACIYDCLSLTLYNLLSIDSIKYKDLTHCILTGLNFIKNSKE